MKIAFNPSTVAALIAPPNNKDITFDLRGQNIFARGVKFCGTDTNTWRDIKINNVSIDSNILDLRNGDNTTLTNINGVVTINSTWRPVVDNLTSDSTTSSLSANQGRILAELINGKSDSGHNHDGRYLRLTGGIMQLGEGLKFHADDNYFGTNEDARIISLLDGNDKVCDGGLIIDERATYNGTEYVTELLRIRDSEFKWKGSNILHSGNSNINGNTITINGSSITVSKSDHTHAYLPLSGGTMIGSIKFNGNSLPQKTLSYVCGIDAFADGGEMGWMRGSDFVVQYAPTKTGLGASGTWDISITGNADTVDGYHASSLVKFYLSPMTSGAPADSAKSWFTNTMPSASGAIVYNVPGSEKTIIAGKSSGTYGHMLQLNYDDTYLRILRYVYGSWKSTDWEKISAGYADLAGSVAWGNVTGKPSSYTPSAHTHSWTSITDKLVGGNEFNIVNTGFDNPMWFNYLPIDNRNSTAYIHSYHFGNGQQGYAPIQASGFVKTGSSSSYVLLGDGGHKSLSDFMSSTVKYALSDTIGGNALQAYKIYYPSVLKDQASIDNFHEACTFKYSLWEGNLEGMGSSFPGTYNGIILSGGWVSAKYGFQLAIDDDPNYFIALRQKGNDTWSTWKQIPMGDGTGASGTWGINITGSAGSVAWGNITGKPSSFTPASHNHSFTLGATTITTGETRTAINGPFAVYTYASAEKAFSIYRDNVYEGVKHWVDDGMYHIEYTNDEAISNIAIRLIDTDSERATNKGADAKDVTVYLDCYRNFYPSSDNTGSIGISSRKWANMYATTFHGLLDGNATTATNADTVDGYHASSFSLTNHTHDYIPRHGMMNSAYACIPTYNGETGWHRVATIDAGVGYGSWILYLCGLWSWSPNTNAIIHIDTMHTTAQLTQVSGIVGYIDSIRLVNIRDNAYYVDVHINYTGANTPGTVYCYFLGNGTITPRTSAEKITESVTSSAELDLVNGGRAHSASSVVVNNSDSNSTYRMVWHSGNTLYGTNNIYCNPYSDQIYSAGFRHVSYNSSSYLLRSDGGVAAFNWAGQSGQPTWLWGGNNEHSYYVYNPSNFRVAYASSAGDADTLDGYHYNQLPYIQRLNWWNEGDSHNANDLLSGTTFAYSTHSNCPTTGTIVAFNCINSTGYPLQLQGKYYGEELWFRNRNGDNGTWQTWRELIHSGNIGSQSVNYASSAGNADTVDWYHATDGRTFIGNINWSENWNDVWSDGTHTHPWYGFDHRYPNTGIYSTTISDYYGLTLKTCNVYISMNLNGNVGIGYESPSYKLDVNGQVRASGFHHGSVNSDNYMLLAGGGYKSFGGSDSNPIFLGYLNLDHGNDGTVSSSFYCLGYSVPFTYTRGGNYCRINIPDTTHQTFYIRAAIASVNYSGGGMDTWVGDHRGDGAWWLHCYASGLNEVRVKGFCQRNSNNDSWWGGNPLWSGNSGANRITVCIFGNVTLR